MIRHHELTRWQGECLYQVELTRDPDSGSSPQDFAYAILFAIREGVPIDCVAARAGLTASEIEKLRRVVNLA